MKDIIKEPGRIVIPSDPTYLQALDDFLEETLRGFGMADNDVADVAISVTELVNNAITHGNMNDSQKTVEVKIVRNSDQVEVTIKDQGLGFNPGNIPDPLSDENLLKETGRGIFIVRSLMDKVEFETAKNGGTRVKVVKKFTPVEE
ncbi:MAG: ATP-binding protein [candidate division Zixibacteria bacterium]|nr:ATP-binding protein [candidate division Zixibacteria bacterium]